MGFYNLNPDQIRGLQDPDPGERLMRDGRNLSAVVRQLGLLAPDTYQRVEEYLRAMVPGVVSVAEKELGPKETLEFRQHLDNATEDPRGSRRFLASNMSDGTLRMLGVLAASFQVASQRSPMRLVGIEEPEIALHPGGALKLMDAMIEAKSLVQIMVTTHSPDFLDSERVNPKWIRAVHMDDHGSTIVTPVRPDLLQLVRDRLYTIGELLRLDQLDPDMEAYKQAKLTPVKDLIR